jgi:hypothetical protein
MCYIIYVSGFVVCREGVKEFIFHGIQQIGKENIMRKNKWLDKPNEEGFWWKKTRMVSNSLAIVFVDIRKNNLTFPIFIFDMLGQRREFDEN